MIIFFSILAAIILLTIIITQHPRFGRLPRGERLERIKNSPIIAMESFKTCTTRHNWQLMRDFQKCLGIIYRPKTNVRREKYLP